MPNNNELDPLIGSYQHESHRPRADEALFALRKIASIVKPIMRRRNWHVGVLAEFSPKVTSSTILLGLNTDHGAKINLRLRYPGDPNQFLPLEEVIDTMLHELCHIEIGPHNTQFQALWDQLRDEHEALTRKGYTGEGFLGRGDRLGGQRIPLQEAKRRARAAAEKRRTLTVGSGQRLGGSGILHGQDARAVIAAAIERRMRIQRGCASGTEQGRQVAQNEEVKTEKVTTTRAERDDQNEATIMQAYIDLIEEEESALFGQGYVPPSAHNPVGSRGNSSTTSSNNQTHDLIYQQASIEKEILRQREASPTRRVPRSSSPLQGAQPMLPRSKSQPEPDSSIFPPRPEHQSQLEPDTWTCEVCTLVNPIDYLSCDACAVERPSYFSETQLQLPPRQQMPPTPRHQQQQQQHRQLSNNKSDPKDKRSYTNSQMKPRMTSAQAYERFEREGNEKIASQSIGWQCGGCGNFMEHAWWTCSVCGMMKSTS